MQPHNKIATKQSLNTNTVKKIQNANKSKIYCFTWLSISRSDTSTIFISGIKHFQVNNWKASELTPTKTRLSNRKFGLIYPTLSYK